MDNTQSLYRMLKQWPRIRRDACIDLKSMSSSPANFGDRRFAYEASALCLRSGDSRVLRVKSLRARGVTCAVRGRVGRSVVLRDSCGSYGEMTRVVGTRWLVHTGMLFLGLSVKTTRLYPSLRLLSVAFGPKKNQIQFSLLVKLSKVSLNLFKDKRIKLKRALRIQTHVRCVLISHAFICFYLFILLWDKNRLAHY